MAGKKIAKKEKENKEEIKKGIIHFASGCILEITLQGKDAIIVLTENGKQHKGCCTLKEE